MTDDCIDTATIHDHFKKPKRSLVLYSKLQISSAALIDHQFSYQSYDHFIFCHCMKNMILICLYLNLELYCIYVWYVNLFKHLYHHTLVILIKDDCHLNLRYAIVFTIIVTAV